MRVLIVGCGYVGLPLGAELVKQGHEVFGLKRSPPAAELTAAGITPLCADISQAETLIGLPHDFDWVVNCAASGGGDVEAYRQLYLQGTRNLIEWLVAAGVPSAASDCSPSPPENEERAGERRSNIENSSPLSPALSPLGRGEGVSPLRLKKFVYTSSTGVYGQNDGSAVKESSPTEPESETARVLVATEQVLLEAAREKNFPTVILRVAGIYGPERGYLLKQYLRNEARIEGKGERILNMIHRDDLIGAIIAALRSGRAGEIYNAVDDEPVSQFHFFEWLSGTLDKPLPPSVPADVDVARKRGVTNKKVSNRRLRMELGYQFKYPNFRKGYTAELQRLEESGEAN